MASQFYDPTQPTQVDDDIVDLPNSNVDLADSFWGYLQPCSQAHKRFSFALDQPDQTVGRNKHNTVRLENAKISNFHAQIKWDGGMGHEGMVTLKDISTNGTFINGERISKHSHYVLRDGSEIGFGTTSVQCAIPKDDFRFIYRFTAASAKAITVHKFYELANELGKGTFATVMKAVKRATGEPVAIKMIHKQLRKKLQREGDSTIGGSSPDDSDPTSVAFRREIEVMEKMDHPNICGLRETFWDDGGGPKSSYQCYLVLELVPGGDLLDYISRYEGLDDLESKQITFQMCRALEYIHLQEIAHRDLKPENVLLTNDHPPIVKIADFGLAKALDSMTMLKTMCGTPSYLAPEVVSQHRTGEGYDLVVDSWSLGVIVFSMLTNSSPFIENSELDIKSRIEQRSIDWETLKQSPASKQASDFIRRLLEPDPARRLQLIHSLAEPWFKKYVPPAHHIIPDNYWQDDHRPGPIIRNPETGEEIPRTQVLKPPPTHSATQARPSSGPSIIGLSQLKVGSMKDVDDEEEEDEAVRVTPPPDVRPSQIEHNNGPAAQPLVRRSLYFRQMEEDPEVLRRNQPDEIMIQNFAMMRSGKSSTPAPPATKATKGGRKRGVEAMEVDPPSPSKTRKIDANGAKQKGARGVPKDDSMNGNGNVLGPRRSTRTRSRKP